MSAHSWPSIAPRTNDPFAHTLTNNTPRLASTVDRNRRASNPTDRNANSYVFQTRIHTMPVHDDPQPSQRPACFPGPSALHHRSDIRSQTGVTRATVLLIRHLGKLVAGRLSAILPRLDDMHWCPPRRYCMQHLCGETPSPNSRTHTRPLCPCVAP